MALHYILCVKISECQLKYAKPTDFLTFIQFAALKAITLADQSVAGTRHPGLCAHWQFWPWIIKEAVEVHMG